MQSMPIPVLLTDTEWNVLDFSRPAAEFLRMPEEEIKGSNLVDLLPAGDRKVESDFLHNFMHRFKGEERELIPHPVLRESWVELRKVFFGQAYFIVLEDATHEMRIQRMRNMLADLAQMGTWEVDLLKGNMHWSVTTREIHELPEDVELDIEGAMGYYKEGFSRDSIRQAVHNAIEHGEPFDLECILVTHKGNEKWIRSMGQTELRDGKCARIYGIFLDIDAQVRERRKYKTLNDRYDMATKGGYVGVWDLDIKTGKLFWSESLFELYDAEKAAFDASFGYWEKHVHPEDRERAGLLVQQAIANGTSLNMHFRIITRSGSIRHLQANARVFCDKYGNPERMIGTNTDITRQKRSDERLRNLLNILEEQNKSLVNYAHIVSHNLRSNSSNLTMLSRMLVKCETEAQRQEYMQMMNSSIERLNETITHLNEVIRVRFDNETQLQAVNLLETLERCREGLNAMIEDSGLELRILVPRQFDVQGIQSYLESVFNNLITNSIKYRRPGVTPQVTVTADYVDDKVFVSFRDNGLGIDLETYGDQIFGMYKTFHGHGNSKGIGLFLTKNHMLGMKGSIDLKSTVGQGTEFILTFKKWGQ